MPAGFEEFGKWWDSLKETEQGKLDAAVRLLEEHGPDLPYPLSSGVNGSRHTHMRELRTQAQGQPLRDCTPLIRGERQSFWFEETRLEIRGGTRATFRLQTGYTTSTWKS
jgi:hypothetical protein